MARDTQILDHSTSLPAPSPVDEPLVSDETRPEAAAFEDLLPTLENLRERVRTLDAERAEDRRRWEEAQRLKDELATQIDQLLEERSQLSGRLDEVDTLLGEARRDAQRLGQENEELKRRYQKLLESTSWRLTAPLRALLDRFRRHPA